MSSRRVFILGLAAGALAASGVRAQQQGATRRTLRVGWLSPGPVASQTVLLDVLRKGLRDVGYVEGKDLTIEARWGDGKTERLPALAKELAASKVDVIVTAFTVSAIAASQAVKTVPIVFTMVADPVQAGLIQDLARPGGNITGLSSVNVELAPKRLQLLNEVLPKITRVGFLFRAELIADRGKHEEIVKVVRRFGVQLISADTHGTQYEAAFESLAKARAQAVIVVLNPSSFDNRRAILDLALKHRIPAMCESPAFVDDGALISYSISQQAQIGRAAVYVDRIFKGTKPGDLPIEQPSTLELVINQKNAKALGIKIPDSVLLRADRVIE